MEIHKQGYLYLLSGTDVSYLFVALSRDTRVINFVINGDVNTLAKQLFLSDTCTNI